MNTLLMTILTLAASSALASSPATSPADLEAIDSASRYLADNCAYDRGDLALVLESSVDEARRYDQNLFDHYFTMTYGSRSAHTGKVTNGTLVLSGARNYNDDRIAWSVSSDTLRLCR